MSEKARSDGNRCTISIRSLLGYLRPSCGFRGRIASGLLLLGLLALLGTSAVVAIDQGQAEEELIILTNVDRTSNGVPALLPDDSLRSVARFRSEDMVARNYFSHNIPPDGHLVFAELDARGIRYLRAGENIGRTNQPDYLAVGTVEQAFMNSPQHRAILLWPGYTSLGTGAAARSDGMKVYTVLFTQAPSPAPTQQVMETTLPSPIATVEQATESPSPRATPQPSSTPAQFPSPVEHVLPTVVSSASPTTEPSATAGAIPSPTSSPPSGRVELSLPRAVGLIEQIIRSILSLFLNLG